MDSRLRIVSFSVVAAISLSQVMSLFAFTGTDGAAFLNIPVGGRPAALGGAYTALADDAYAPIFNAGGLGFVPSSQLSLMHLSYIDSVSYEFASFVHPFSAGHSIGLSVQNLRTGSIPSTDANGNANGDFSSSSFAYSLAYGQTIGKIFSLGLAAKLIQSSIASESASASAVDIGAMLRPSDVFGLGAAVTNIGSEIKFVDQSDPLPLTFRLGGFYRPTNHWVLALQGSHARSDSTDGQAGLEYSPVEMFAFRFGYRTETVDKIDGLTGFTTGVGVRVAGQQFDYAWAPLGDLGNTQYFSLLFQWGLKEPGDEP